MRFSFTKYKQFVMDFIETENNSHDIIVQHLTIKKMVIFKLKLY